MWHSAINTSNVGFLTQINYKKYAPDTIFLELRPEVKVIVPLKPQTKFEISISNYIGDILGTVFFLETKARGQSQGHSDRETVCHTT